MGTRERYEPGTFSWVELATSDADAAKRFYTELFGWEYEDTDMGDQGVYSMARRDGHYVGALFKSEQPPHWNSYITVESADETAEKVSEHGGTLVMEPFDVFDSGRMLFIQDPTGAMVAAWEAKAHIGAGLVNAPGALTWNDLMTTDVQKAAEFYGNVFGWELGAVEGAPDDRMAIKVGDRMNGGMAKLPEGAGEAQPHWMPYFAVDDADSAARTITENGGKVLVEPMEVPAGRFVLALDPQGAAFAIFSGEFDD